MTTESKAGEALDLNKLATIADRVEARGLFNAACDIRDWIQEVHVALARASSAAPAGQQAVVGIPMSHRAVIEEAAQVLESAAAHNRAKGRTVLERTQQDRADRLRAILAAPAATVQPSEPFGYYIVEGDDMPYPGAGFVRELTEGRQYRSVTPLFATPLPTKEGVGEVDAKDAARYRFLRNGAAHSDLFIAKGDLVGDGALLDGENADQAIDAAIAAQPKDTTDTEEKA